MKIISIEKFATHPLTMLASISAVIISSEQMAAPLMIIVIMNLSSLQLFSVIIAIALLLLFFSYFLIRIKTNPVLHYVLNISATLLLAGGIPVYLYSINESTRQHTYATLSFIITFFLAVLFLLSYLMKNIYQLMLHFSKKQ